VSRAWAQSIQIPSPPTRDVNTRSDPNTFNWISHDDCSMNDVLHFPLIVGQGAGRELEVWAGLDPTDCTIPMFRTSAAARCLRLYAGPVDALMQPVSIRAQDLALIEGSFVPDGQGKGTSADCDPMTALTAPASFNLFFLLFDPGAFLQVASTSWGSAIDLVAPGPPTSVTAKSLSGALQVAWTPSTDPDVQGYDILCGAAPPVGCTPIELVPGQTTTSQSVAQHLCGTVQGNVRAVAVAQPLPNGQRVQVAVASFDLVGNVGPLSELACETPVAGSLSINGCSCSLGAVPRRFEGWTVLALFFGGAARRKRRMAIPDLRGDGTRRFGT
jgi:hypothetical protein